MSDTEFAALFAGRAAGTRRTAYLLCGDWHRAEDLTQTAFAKLYAAWPRLRDPGAADAYLRRTLTRTYVDEYRRAWRAERPTADVPDVVDATRGDTDDRLVLLAALAEIPPRQRACVVLRYFDDYAVDAVAEALGCSVGTVKSNTARGLATLRRILGPAVTELATIGGDLA